MVPAAAAVSAAVLGLGARGDDDLEVLGLGGLARLGEPRGVLGAAAVGLELMRDRLGALLTEQMGLLGCAQARFGRRLEGAFMAAHVELGPRLRTARRHCQLLGAAAPRHGEAGPGPPIGPGLSAR